MHLNKLGILSLRRILLGVFLIGALVGGPAAVAQEAAGGTTSPSLSTEPAVGLDQPTADAGGQPASDATPPTSEDATQAKPKRKKQDWLTRTFNYIYNLGARFWGSLLILAGLGFLIRRFARTELFAKLGRTLTEDVLTNWRLLLLGLTGIVLSLASGYTTWDGMTNFTCPARASGDLCAGPMVLSLMITFGIQGVMLIAAWLIGESFAQGLSSGHRTASAGKGPMADLAGWIISGILVLAGLTVAVVIGLLVLSPLSSSTSSFDAATGLAGYVSSHWEALWYVVLGAAALGALTFMLSEREIIGPYFRGLRIVLKNLPIWLMFLACMATSVFFSFDSLFSTIFPPDERRRAADIRTTNQVAGLIADLNTTMAKRQAEEVGGLFHSQGWADYNGRLEAITEIARSAPGEIEAMRTAELNSRQSARASLQEKKASATSQLTGLENRKTELIEIKLRLNSEVAPIAAEVERLKAEVFKKDSEIIGKKAEAEAERGGVGGSLKAGAGPEFAKRRKELGDLDKLKTILQSQLKEFASQLKAKRDGSVAAEAELAQIDGEIGKLKGEVQVADQQMDLGATMQSSTDAPDVEVTGGFASLDSALAEFRQRPERATFGAVQQHCMVLLGVFDKVPNLKAQAAAQNSNCDPTVVAEATGRIFAITEGLAAFKVGCAKGENLPQGNTDALLEFGGRCIQNSGLAGADTQRFRLLLNRAALNRDDKAHRFVVTWNAFLDGNQLAYLALAIALAMDGLVFMSGLFGANAVRSPLTDAPHGRSRSASQLEAIINSSLEPDRFGNARLALAAMKPMTPEDSFIAEVHLGEHDADAATRIKALLNAGAILNTVRRDDLDTGRYFVRAELFEYLSELCDRELRTNQAARESAERERLEAARSRFEMTRDVMQEQEIEHKSRRLWPVLEAALTPDHYENVLLVANAMKPVSDPKNAEGFVSEIAFPAPGRSEQENNVILAVLNAGSTYGAVVRDTAGGTGELYLIKPELTLTLSAIKLQALGSSSPLGNGGTRRMLDVSGNGTRSVHISSQPQARQQIPHLGAEQAPDAGNRRPPTVASAQANSTERFQREFVEEYARTLGFSADELRRMQREKWDSLRQMDAWSKRSEQDAELVYNFRRAINDDIDAAFAKFKKQTTDDVVPVLESVTREIRELVPAIVCRRMLQDYQGYEGEQVPQA